MRPRVFDLPASSGESLQAAVAAALESDQPERAASHLFAPLPLRRVLRRWGRHPFVVRRSSRDYFGDLLPVADLKAQLDSGRLRYGLELDAAVYDERAGGRSTLNDGQALVQGADAAARFAAGASLRFLHPQRRCDRLFELCSALERFFDNNVGCNAYWTPPGAQGFAPHYDDIDAVVLQLHGSKRWRLYAPRSADEALPRFSSGNYSADQLPPPLLEVELHQGDTLYLPRGCIHEARSCGGDSSLHVTLSTGQRHTWGDLLGLALPAALAAATEANPMMRLTLPRRLLGSLGVAHCERGGRLRARALAFAGRLLAEVAASAPLDAAADQLAAAFQRTRARPPPPPPDSRAPLRPASRVRLAFGGAARLCVEGDEGAVYHPFANERATAMGGGEAGEEDCRVPLPSLDDAPTVEALILAYPRAVALRDLPAEGEDVASLVRTLLDASVLVRVS